LDVNYPTPNHVLHQVAGNVTAPRVRPCL
jgi:hypothetical protein